MDREIKKAIILEHYQNPINRGLINDNTYIRINTNSKSCIDEIDLMVKLDNNKIKDVRFDGEACAICTSSTSIMIKTLLDKTLEEALVIINSFENMIEEQPYNYDVLGEAIVYSDISKQPNRKKCALLTWQGMKKIINEEK